MKNYLTGTTELKFTKRETKLNGKILKEEVGSKIIECDAEMLAFNNNGTITKYVFR